MRHLLYILALLPYSLFAMEDLSKEFDDHKANVKRMTQPTVFIEKCFEAIDNADVDINILEKTVEMYISLITDSKYLNFKKAFSPHNSDQQNKHLDAIAKIFSKIDRKKGFVKTNYQETYRNIANANFQKAVGLKNEHQEKYEAHLEWLRLFFWQADKINGKPSNIYNYQTMEADILTQQVYTVYKVGSLDSHKWSTNLAFKKEVDFYDVLLRARLSERYHKASSAIHLLKNETPLFKKLDDFQSLTEEQKVLTEELLFQSSNQFSIYINYLRNLYHSDFEEIQKKAFGILDLIGKKLSGADDKIYFPMAQSILCNAMSAILFNVFKLSEVLPDYTLDTIAQGYVSIRQDDMVPLNITIKVLIGSDPKEFYKTLGVSKSATAEDIKKAYKKLAMQWHPDKNPKPKAADKFQQISEAYTTLSDIDERQKYDETGLSLAFGSQRINVPDFLQ